MERKFDTCEEGKLIVDKKHTLRLKGIVQNILNSCNEDGITTHIDEPLIPDLEEIKNILIKIEDLLYPGFFGNQELQNETIEYHIGNEVSEIFSSLSVQIARSLRHKCKQLSSICIDCIHEGQRQAVEFLDKIADIRRLLKKDVEAALVGDPAAKSYSEIVFSYPGLKAITLHRAAHELYLLNTPLIPRIINEYAHKTTGIDIHPGAKIGESFFIDHGTGVVIGETTEIGNNVKIYQGVTLGALSFPRDKHGNIIRGQKRHPTIEDNVTIYSGATILGGKTIIGKGSVIGGNVFLTSSVLPNSKVVNRQPEMNQNIEKL